jgi:hypothetical protein
MLLIEKVMVAMIEAAAVKTVAIVKMAKMAEADVRKMVAAV